MLCADEHWLIHAGDVVNVRVVPGKAFCFVTFRTEAAASEAIATVGMDAD